MVIRRRTTCSGGLHISGLSDPLHLVGCQQFNSSPLIELSSGQTNTGHFMTKILKRGSDYVSRLGTSLAEECSIFTPIYLG